MNTTKIAAAAATLGAGLLMSAGAFAAEATASVNVRSGPGTNFGVVDTLFAGENISVGECRSNGWCYITHSGPDGWVSARYISDDDDDDVEVRRPQPSVSFSFSFGRGDGFSRPGGPRGGPRDLVCLVTFYRADQVAGGADADVQRAQVLTRNEAERRDRPNDRRGIFDYGTNQQTRETCRYLDRLND